MDEEEDKDPGKRNQIAEMKTEIIKYEISNVNSIQDMRQLKRNTKLIYNN